MIRLTFGLKSIVGNGRVLASELMGGSELICFCFLNLLLIDCGSSVFDDR